MSHAYEETLRTLYDALIKRDMETVMSLLTDDIEFYLFRPESRVGQLLG